MSLARARHKAASRFPSAERGRHTGRMVCPPRRRPAAGASRGKRAFALKTFNGTHSSTDNKFLCMHLLLVVVIVVIVVGIFAIVQTEWWFCLAFRLARLCAL